MKPRSIACLVGATALGLCAAARAQNFDLSWHTIDGGGGTSAGGTFSLSGTIAQPDAGSFALPLTGGAFTLVGGFWPVAGPICTLPGDMNLDGVRNGIDIQQFVNCVIGVNGSNCACADLDGNGVTDSGDVAMFVNSLL